MPSLNQPRSSDSNIDFDHAATLHELRELTVFEKEYESPPPEVSSSPSSSSLTRMNVHRQTSSYPVSGNVNRTEELEHEDLPPPPSSSISSREPRNVAHNVAETEKILVFRDQTANTPKTTPLRRTKGQNQTTQAGRQMGKVRQASCDKRAHVRSKSDPEIPNTHILDKIGDKALDTSEAKGSVTSTVQRCVAQLQAIALQRDQLLHQLSHLHQQEQSIISSLHEAYRSPASANIHGKNTKEQLHDLHPSAIRHQEPHPQNNATFTVSLSTDKAAATASRSSKASGRRPVSAPPLPPSRLRQNRNASTSSAKRTPLADKTDASKDTMPCPDHVPLSRSLPIQVSPRTGFHPTYPGDGTDHNSYVEATPVCRGRTFQVPTNFGVEDDDDAGHDIVVETPTAKILSSTATGIPKLSKSSKPRRPRDTAATSASEVKKDYVVPHTVARKKWAF
ncbi:hypothetical protein DM02DRAFT_675474 [Periconia macrospinosa]|uniref:Uncharacterized protein n=1 Tax=Periconia macrospinosa TaxID=97972 RepID=A0A2V1DBH2_9PLEO|nr:hypothetical protein DM02DRAFT_675474 [Periconia macrospinosa]